MNNQPKCLGKTIRTVLGSLVLMLVCSSVAHAHDCYQSNGFMSGLWHPVLGLDHLLAMLGVGMVSTQMGGRAIWTVPLAFVVGMLVGGILGMMGTNLPLVEYGIVLSVVIIGVVLAVARKIPVEICMTAVVFFAIFHGHAHGVEMPSAEKPVLFATGFVLGTSLIHIVGIFIAMILEALPKGPVLLRFSGLAMVGYGLWLLFQYVVFPYEML